MRSGEALRAHETVVPFPPGSIDAMLRASAVRDPDHAAVIEAGTPVTFGQLDAWADAVAGQLGAGGGAPGRTAVLLSLSAQTLALYYGLIRAGEIVVPLNPLQPPPLLVRNMTEAGVTRCVADPAAFRRLAEAPGLPGGVEYVVAHREGHCASVLRTERERCAEPPTDGPVREPGAPPDDETQTAAVLFTSGTTGAPKGVVVSHRAVKANAWQMSSAHELTASSVLLCHLPILNPMHTNAAVFVGATQVICPSPDIVDAARLATAHGVTHFYTQPVRLDALAMDPALREVTMPSVRYIAAGSRAIGPEVFEALSARFGAYVFQGYGQTESCYMSHSDTPRRAMPGSVGFGLAETRTRISDLLTGQPLPPGQLGQLELRGPQLMSGYLHRPDLHPFTDDGWFRSGDVGWLDDDDRLYVVDRIVDVAFRYGQVVSPSRLEREFEREPEIRHAGAVVVPRAGEPRICVFVTTPRPEDPGASAGADEACTRVNDRLAMHERVDELVVVDVIPRLPVNGKVDRKVLAQWAARAAAEAVGAEG